MKTLVTDYTFDASTRQITFTDNTYTVSLEQILLITNVTDGIIIYNFADPNAGGTVANNVLTLTYNTTTMSDTDILQIFLDLDVAPLPAGAATEATQEDIVTLLRLLQKTTTYARDAGDRLRVSVDSQSQSTIYNRNSSTSLNAGTEAFYSYSSWNTVDAREQLMSIQNNVISAAMQRWRFM